jgi:outer membrane immunogenic protein
MKRLLLVAAMAFAAIGPATAADLPAPPPRVPVYVPTVAPVYNWGGLYFGVNGGYGFGTSKWTDPNNFSGTGSTGNFNVSGFLVGGTLGYNFQADAFVFGVEGDFDGSWMDGKVANTFCGSVGFGAGAQCETRNTWLSTLRGRFGYAADRVLFYGTAGGAFGSIQTGVGGNLQSTTKAGWTAGGGVEAALADNWTVRVEYLFVDLQKATCNNPGACGVDAPVPPIVPANDTIKFDSSVVRVGVDYKFH